MGNGRNVTIGGNVSGATTIVTGDGNLVGSQVASLEELQRLLGELRHSVAGAGMDADLRDVIEGDLDTVERQLKKPEPSGGLVVGRIKAVVDTLTSSVGGAADTVEKLIPLGTKIAEIAAKLFPG